MHGFPLPLVTNIAKFGYQILQVYNIYQLCMQYNNQSSDNDKISQFNANGVLAFSQQWVGCK